MSRFYKFVFFWTWLYWKIPRTKLFFIKTKNLEKPYNSFREVYWYFHGLKSFFFVSWLLLWIHPHHWQLGIFLPNSSRLFGAIFDRVKNYFASFANSLSRCGDSVCDALIIRKRIFKLHPWCSILFGSWKWHGLSFCVNVMSWSTCHCCVQRLDWFIFRCKYGSGTTAS